MRTHWAYVNDREGVMEKVRVKLGALASRHDNETPEMWCSRIRGPFRKILEENPKYLSKYDYIQMHGRFYEDGKPVHGGSSSMPTNYIYCTVCDSLVFLPVRLWGTTGEKHFMRCIAGNTASEQKEDLLLAITRLEGSIWQQKQSILLYEAEIKCIQLELSPQSQSLSHSENYKLALVTYDIHHISYKTYRASVVKDDTNPFRSTSAPPLVKTQDKTGPLTPLDTLDHISIQCERVQIYRWMT
jgi:hypothetical protein